MFPWIQWNKEWFELVLLISGSFILMRLQPFKYIDKTQAGWSNLLLCCIMYQLTKLFPVFLRELPAL